MSTGEREHTLRVWDLKHKEVINICNCRKLGCVCDIVFDECNGYIIAIIVPGPGKLFGFLGREMEYVIPWCDIKQIGPDIILVEVDEEVVFVKCEY